MALEWPVVFQGVAAASAVIQAVKAALEARKLTREELKAVAQEAEKEATAEPAETPDKPLDEDMIETVDKKIKGAKKKWQDAIDGSDDQDEWAKATDRYRSDICAILRNIKQINGGVLPGKLYPYWTANQCA